MVCSFAQFPPMLLLCGEAFRSLRFRQFLEVIKFKFMDITYFS